MGNHMPSPQQSTDLGKGLQNLLEANSSQAAKIAEQAAEIERLKLQYNELRKSTSFIVTSDDRAPADFAGAPIRRQSASELQLYARQLAMLQNANLTLTSQLNSALLELQKTRHITPENFSTPAEYIHYLSRYSASQGQTISSQRQRLETEKEEHEETKTRLIASQKHIGNLENEIADLGNALATAQQTIAKQEKTEDKYLNALRKMEIENARLLSIIQDLLYSSKDGMLITTKIQMENERFKYEIARLGNQMRLFRLQTNAVVDPEYVPTSSINAKI